jgi:hypothetical protein
MLDLAPDKILSCIIVQRFLIRRPSPQVLKIIIPTRMHSWLLHCPISKRLPISLFVFLSPLPVDHPLLKRIEIANVRYSLHSLWIYVLIKIISPLIMSEECLNHSIFIQGHKSVHNIHFYLIDKILMQLCVLPGSNVSFIIFKQVTILPEKQILSFIELLVSHNCCDVIKYIQVYIRISSFLLKYIENLFLIICLFILYI